MFGLKFGNAKVQKPIFFAKVENFPPKVEKFPPVQNVPIHVILEYKFFFVEFFRGGKFSTKVEKISLHTFGMEFGKRQGPDTEKRNFTKVESFPQKVENLNFPPLQNVPIHVILD